MTKKILICTVLSILLFCAPALSQQYGVKAGLNFASISYDDEEGIFDITSTTRFNFGGFFSIRLHDAISFQPEVCYAQKGAEYSVNFLGIQGEAVMKLDYLEIPLLVKYTLGKQGKITPSLFAGPFLGFKMSSTLKTTVTAQGVTESEEEDLEDVKSTNFGLVFGGELTYNMGSFVLFFDVRYSLGLSNIVDTDEADPGTVKVHAFTIMIGIGK